VHSYSTLNSITLIAGTNKIVHFSNRKRCLFNVIIVNGSSGTVTNKTSVSVKLANPIQHGVSVCAAEAI
jgi:hypothetical protein